MSLTSDRSAPSPETDRAAAPVPGGTGNAVPVLADGRIPSLDGLRAISITAVVLGHLAGTTNFPALIGDPIRNNGLVNIADVGVRVFFVISGFLITGILMKESRRAGGISLGRFYLRRTMRIFPAYYVFVATVAVLTALGVFSVRSTDFVHAFTYTTNYDPDRAWEVGHLWSLAVEEQFYLLWPLTIILLGLRNAKAAVVLVILTAPLFRAFEYQFVPGWREIVGNTFETAADAIALGCLMALTFDRLVVASWFKRLMAAPWVILVVLAAALVLGQWGVTNLLFSMSLMNVAIALAIAYLVLHSDGLTGRFLNLRPIVYIGTLSYSIYLWQQIFVNRNSTLVISTFPLDLVLMAVFAMGSYYLVERPFLRLRPKVEERLLGSRRGSKKASLEEGDGPAQVPSGT